MGVSLTKYHAQYFAYELTRSLAADDQGKFTASLQNATVDLNPHQVEAALFAFKSPLSKGALLADEVGLGKTIEAGIILSQKWAERKRRLLIIAPANLRKQWNQELADKFFLPSTIIEAKSFNQVIKSGNLNPFEQSEILICSYQFARSKESYLRHIQWDLVIIDEAHRLRNVYRPDNKIGKSIKSALAHTQKVLLTATPLQNSLLELYGLVSIIDDYTFGDLKSFKSNYARISDGEHSLEREIKDLDAEIRLRKAEARKLSDLESKVQERRHVKELEKQRDEKRRHLFEKLVISGTDDFFPELQELCRKAGVKVVHTPCLPKAPLHGSTRWVKGNPLIQLSNRLNSNDIFWFTFFHEAAHILKHNKKDVFVEGMEYSCDGKEKEAEANAFAEECLMSRKEEKELMVSGAGF